MWLLFQRKCDIFTYGFEYNTNYVEKMIFRGAYVTKEAAFQTSLSLKYEDHWAPQISIIEYEIDTYFKIEDFEPEYITNGESIIEISTGKCVFGDNEILELYDKVRELAKYSGSLDRIMHNALNYNIYGHELYGLALPENPYFLYGLNKKSTIAFIQELEKRNPKK